MEAGGVLAVERNRGVRAASLFVVSDELGGEGWNPGFDDPRFLAGKRRARRLLLDVILRRGGRRPPPLTRAEVSHPRCGLLGVTPPTTHPGPTPHPSARRRA